MKEKQREGDKGEGGGGYEGDGERGGDKGDQLRSFNNHKSGATVGSLPFTVTRHRIIAPLRLERSRRTSPPSGCMRTLHHFTAAESM